MGLIQLYTELKMDRDFGSKLPQLVKKATGVQTFGGMSMMSAQGTTHTVRQEEQVAFSNWINKFVVQIQCVQYKFKKMHIG